ncbi:MAG: acetylglutamate kinase [Dehalococcoidia bacterium]|nr:acetylglutamate kinase [Dehalococcoidia bacterium]
MEKVIVVKIGGSTLGSHDTTLEDLVLLQKRGVSTLLVHGGGQQVSSWFSRSGIPSRFIDGLRVTNAEGLEIATAVLAGLVNKRLVLRIQALGGKTIGLSGIDGNMLWASVKKPELGYVGEIARVNTTLLELLLGKGYIPVLAPICSGIVGDGVSLLNVNGDAAAGEIAAAIGAEKLVFLTDVDGIHDDSGKSIARLTPAEAQNMIGSGTASGGMIPKIEACLKALTAVRQARIVDGRASHTLLREIENGSGGTTIASG